MKKAIVTLVLFALPLGPVAAQHASPGAPPPKLPVNAQMMRDMPDASQTMPKLAPTRVFQVPENMDWTANTGFGTESFMVAMMNLMMVGGSGYENMRMKPMKPGSSGQSASSMLGMSMPGMAMPGMAPTGPSSPPTDATVTPNPPVVGENTVSFTVRDAQGHPRLGLKLAASVAMTSMDMGTARPPVKELGGGRYQVVAPFTMAGPWRVTLSGEGVNLALDFNAGGKEPWTAGAAAAPQPTLADLMNSHLDKSDKPVGLPAPEVAAGDQAGPTQPETATGEPPGQTTPGGPDTAASKPSTEGPAAPGQTAQPAATPLKVTATVARPKVGDNTVDIRVVDAAGKPISGAKVAASIAMTSMDMGTTRPPVKDLGNGRYRTTASFSMSGPWRITLTVTPPAGKPSTASFDFRAP